MRRERRLGFHQKTKLRIIQILGRLGRHPCRDRMGNQQVRCIESCVMLTSRGGLRWREVDTSRSRGVLRFSNRSEHLKEPEY